MRQVLYVSDSLIGPDVRALDRIMVEARANNSIDGTTGLLWTDADRFAQVIEGGDDAVGALLSKLRLDPRHTNLAVVQDSTVDHRQFGEWSMSRPAGDPFAEMYQRRVSAQLAWLKTELSSVFESVISGSRLAAGR